MGKQTYWAIIQEDEDGNRVARVIGLPEIQVSAQSLDESLELLRVALLAYIEDHGRPRIPRFVGLHLIDVPL